MEQPCLHPGEVPRVLLVILEAIISSPKIAALIPHGCAFHFLKGWMLHEANAIWKRKESLCRLTVAAGKPPETPNCELQHLLPVPREPSRQPHPLNFQVKIAVNKDSFKTNSDQDSSQGMETGELFILLILSTSGQAHCFT